MAAGAVLGVVLALIPGATAGTQIYECLSTCGEIYKRPPCNFFNTPVSRSLSFFLRRVHVELRLRKGERTHTGQKEERARRRQCLHW